MSPNKSARTILAIDTSCDETSVAVVHGWEVWSNIVASQAELHKQYGGVFPTVAKMAHTENLPATVRAALRRAHLDWDAIDAIAVTQGPGLAPALEVGITYAQELAAEHHKPLIPINHIEGHIWSVMARPRPRQTPAAIPADQLPNIAWPVLGVVISGGHSEFWLITGPGQYQLLGKTIDDAAGEALDKVGRMLGLGYPAGPIMEEFARRGDASRYAFPLPMTTSGDYNLSFSGLKTFARNLLEKIGQTDALSQQDIFDLCASFQKAVFRHICHKLNKILLDHQDLGEVWLGGGVAANTTLRASIRQTLRSQRRHTTTNNSPILPLRVPPSKRLCGDNAAMIGLVAQWRPATATFDRQPNLSFSESQPAW
jgi:N6-L-threonylcarbamoyladenine synthase